MPLAEGFLWAVQALERCHACKATSIERCGRVKTCQPNPILGTILKCEICPGGILEVGSTTPPASHRYGLVWPRCLKFQRPTIGSNSAPYAVCRFVTMNNGITSKFHCKVPRSHPGPCGAVRMRPNRAPAIKISVLKDVVPSCWATTPPAQISLSAVPFSSVGDPCPAEMQVKSAVRIIALVTTCRGVLVIGQRARSSIRSLTKKVGGNCRKKHMSATGSR